MKPLLVRIAGILLIAASITGFLFSVAGLVIIWRLEPRLAASSLSTIALLERTLETTASGLEVASSSLSTANGTVANLEMTTRGAGGTIGGTIPLIESMADLAGEDLPVTVRATQQSLAVVESSATVVDSTLRVLAALPLLLGAEYSPPVSLQTSIAGVSDSLEGLPAALIEMRTSLHTTADNLERVEADMDKVAVGIGAIKTDLANAQAVISQYQGVIKELRASLEALRAGLPRWLRLIALSISLILVWLGVAQFGLLTRGLEMIGRSRRTRINRDGP